MTEKIVPSRIGPWHLNLLEHRDRFYWTRGHIWELMRLAHAHGKLQPGMQVYDVGAECGDFTALYGTWGCDVVPIEPQPGYWPSIKAHCDANDIKPVATFLGFCDEEGSAPVVRDWPHPADGEITPEAGFLHVCADEQTARTSVDLIASQIGVPDALMIDVEGAEYRVLLGARRVLERHHPMLWVSVHTDEGWMLEHYPEQGIDAIANLLEPMGYVGENLAHEHEIHTFWEVPE